MRLKKKTYQLAGTKKTNLFRRNCDNLDYVDQIGLNYMSVVYRVCTKYQVKFLLSKSWLYEQLWETLIVD